MYIFLMYVFHTKITMKTLHIKKLKDCSLG